MANDAITSKSRRVDEATRFEIRSPFARFEIVTATFDKGANVDTDIRTTLRPVNPNNIYYLPIAKDRAADIYHDQTAARQMWQPGVIYLRSTVNNAVVTFLLFEVNT